MSSEPFEQVISKTKILFVPTGLRNTGLKTWRALFGNSYPVATVSQLENGDFVPESMERLRLNVVSLEENNMAWGVYHHAPRADIEAPFGTGRIEHRKYRTPTLMIECALAPGARIDHYQNPGDSLFLEIPSGDSQETYYYQVIDPRWIIAMVSLINAQRHGSIRGRKRPMFLGTLGLDAKIETQTAHLLSGSGAFDMYTSGINASRWPNEHPVSIEHVMKHSAEDTGNAEDVESILAQAQDLYEASLEVHMKSRVTPCWKKAPASNVVKDDAAGGTQRTSAT